MTLCVTLITGFAAGPAAADLAPPVRVRLVSDLQAAKADVPVSGRLAVTCLAAGELKIEGMSGEGWTVSRLDAPRSIAAESGDVIMVEFTARPKSPASRLVFTCTFDGRPFRYGMDFSFENVRRMTGALPTVKLPDTDRDRALPRALHQNLHEFLATAEPAGPQPVGPVVRGNVPTGPLASPAGQAESIDEPSESTSGKTLTTVHGRFFYVRTDNVQMPAHTIMVEVYDDDGAAGDDLLGTTFTDAGGDFSIVVNSDDSGESEPDIYCVFSLLNGSVEVIEPTSGSRYSWVSAVFNDFSGTDLNIGALTPAQETLMPAVHVFTNVGRCWVFDNVMGYVMPAVTCEWPSSNWTSYNSQVIYINPITEWNEHAMAHEYGHFFDDEYSGVEPHNYCNGWCDDPPSCGHCTWCQESSVIAWTEGWANYHGYCFGTWYEGEWGIAPYATASYENLGTCDGSLHPADLTEGFCAALLQDMDDLDQDSHGVFGPYTDVLSGLRPHIFTVVDLDNPDGPVDFIQKFAARVPSIRPALWETAANCGYEVDSEPPGLVSNFTSPSHPLGVTSFDPTIEFTWDPAPDDMSGVAGYGLYIGSAPLEPSEVQDIDDVTSYTTPQLAPGSYYFCIRAVDRAGRWSNNYYSWGPMTIQEPEPADVTWFQQSGWTYPLVPRVAGDATMGDCLISPSLPGDANTTYWNIFGQNAGEASTGEGFWAFLNVDGESPHNAYWGAIAPGGYYYGPNRGPVTVRGGRHAFTCLHDATDAVPESDETNNAWGRQFVWRPSQMSPSVEITRESPPDPTGGWDQVTGGSVSYNCDGLRVDATGGWWNVVATWSDDPDQDIDVRHHFLSLGSEDGFGAYEAWSANADGLDYVVENRNMTNQDYWDAGVANFTPDVVADYHAYQAVSQIISYGDSLTVTMNHGQPVLIREFYVDSGEYGPASIVVDIDPAAGPIMVEYLPDDYTYGANYHTGQVQSDDGGRAWLDVNLATTGWHAFLVYREPANGLPQVDVTFEVQPEPADLTWWHRSGWYSPFVPRPTDDGTTISTPLPDTLYGWPIDATWLNLAVQNEGPADAPIPNDIYRDGEVFGYFNWPVMGGGARVSHNNFEVQFPSGRHVLSVYGDPHRTVEESDETNNAWGEQFIWSPLPVEINAVVRRLAPPPPIGGWDQMTTGEVLWYNCDGLRLPEGGWWTGMAVMPDPDEDVDVRLYPAGTGTKIGFDYYYTSSLWATGLSDYVLVNTNLTERAPFDIGVVQYGGTETGYTAQAAASTSIIADDGGVFGPFSMPAGEILAIYDFHLEQDLYLFLLEFTSGTADLGISLHPANIAFQAKSSALVAEWYGGPGGDEQLACDVPATGWYAVTVWKVGAADLPQSADYTLHVYRGLTGVEGEDVPPASGLVGAYPNPFNPQTKIAYDLARSSRVSLAIYDVQGGLVKQLVSADLPAGHHETMWRGRNSQGRQVASGVYFARLETSDVRQMVKLMLVK
jgi:hypothetical protein